MIAAIFVPIIGVLIFLFLFWKRLKEDYAAEIIFKSAFYILAGILIGWTVSFKLLPQAFLWTSFLGAILGLSLAVRTFKVRYYETLEALVIGSLPWVSLIFLKDSVLTSSLSSFAAFLITLVIIFLYYYFDQHYKSFSWYKSGKIGFSGLATLAIIFLIRAAISISQIPVISFLSKYEAVASGAAAFVSFLLIFNLGRKKE